MHPEMKLHLEAVLTGNAALAGDEEAALNFAALFRDAAAFGNAGLLRRAVRPERWLKDLPAGTRLQLLNVTIPSDLPVPPVFQKGHPWAIRAGSEVLRLVVDPDGDAVGALAKAPPELVEHLLAQPENQSWEPEPAVAALTAVLQDVVPFLQWNDEAPWADHFRQAQQGLAADPLGAAVHCLEAFGGMGSFSDLFFTNRATEERYIRLRDEVFRHATRLARVLASR